MKTNPGCGVAHLIPAHRKEAEAREGEIAKPAGSTQCLAPPWTNAIPFYINTVCECIKDILVVLIWTLEYNWSH